MVRLRAIGDPFLLWRVPSTSRVDSVLGNEELGLEVARWPG